MTPERKRSCETADLRNHPIWGREEDDNGGDWYEPVDLLAETFDKAYWDSLYVYCKLTLADAADMEGVLYIDPWPDPSVFGVTFLHGGDEFHFSGMAFIKGDLAHLERWLGKSASQISPVAFSTPFRWKDGTAIAGIVDLATWRDPFAK